MISAILINDAPLGIRNPTTVECSIEGVTSAAERSESGDIVVLNKVNSIPTVTISWDYLHVDDLQALCVLLKIDVATYGEVYVPKKIHDLVYKVTARLPSGIRSFTAYVGDSLRATLRDHTGSPENGNVGGQYWSDVKIVFVGTGENWST